MSDSFVADPVTRYFALTLEQFDFTKFMLEAGFSYFTHVKVSKSARDELIVLSDLLYALSRWPIECDDHSNGGLAYLVDNYQLFVRLVEEAFTKIDSAAVMLSRENILPSSYGNAVLRAKNNFALLNDRLQHVTPVQLALQRHFVCLIWSHNLVRKFDCKEANPTLFALRDEYFAAPRPQVIREYLVNADAFLRDVALPALEVSPVGDPKTLVAELKAAVDERVTELEVSLLMVNF